MLFAMRMSSVKIEAIRYVHDAMLVLGYSAKFCWLFLSKMVTGTDIDRSVETLVMETTNMAPTVWQSPLKVSDIKVLLDKLELDDEVWFDQSALLRDDLINEEIFSILFPFRTKKDKNLREARFRDVWSAAKMLDLSDVVLEIIIMCHSSSWDYIATVNLCAYYLCTGNNWLNNMYDLGIFPCSLDNFLIKAKKLSDTVKLTPVDIGDRFLYVELACLAGYRNPPFPGFDLATEAKSLADGGTVEHSNPFVSFDAVARETLFIRPDIMESLSLFDYIDSGLWLTAGASSLGKVEWSVNDDTSQAGHFKARKNMLIYIYTSQELYDYCLINTKQMNTTLIKSELGKIRLAVAGDLSTYLKMSWMNYHLNGVYLKWPSSTMSEDLNQSSNRLSRMLNLLDTTWGLPFDYKGFDHQPTINEMKTIVSLLTEMAMCNANPTTITEMTLIATQLVNAFDTAELLTHIDGDKVTHPIIGGLMSGLRWTSTIGNAWNTVITTMVTRMMQNVGLDPDNIERFIRGDDSAIFAITWTQAFSMRIGYQVMKVEGGEGKFSVWKGQMEFLRQWFDGRVYAYPARVLPGWFQHKPWNSEPWSPLSSIKRQAGIRDTLIRRGCDPTGVNALWSATKNIWCRKVRINERYLSIPPQFGGPGLDTWTGWLCTPMLPDIPDLDLNVAVTGSELHRWRKLCMNYRINPTPDELLTFVKSKMIKTFSTDDVPGVSKQVRDRWKTDLLNWRPVWTKRLVEVGRTSIWTLPLQMTTSLTLAKDSVKNQLTKTKNITFGRFRNLAAKWMELQDMAKLGLKQPIKHMPFEFSNQLLLYEKKGLRRFEALGWLFGDISHWCVLNPLVSAMTHNLSLYLMGDPNKRQWHTYEFSSSLIRYDTYSNIYVSTTTWYQKLFNN